MATRAVLQTFERYQKERVAFVTQVSEMAKNPQNRPAEWSSLSILPYLETKAVKDVAERASWTMQLYYSLPVFFSTILANGPVRPFLRVVAMSNPLSTSSNPSCSIQQSAATALGRLANYSDDLAEAVVQNEIIPQLVYSLANQNRYYKKAASYCLRAVARHSPQLAQAVIDCGSLDPLVTCLEEFDPDVKEQAAWALGYIAGHNAELAQQVVAAGAVPLLVLCVQEPELAIKRTAAAGLSDIAKHTPELSQAVIDAGAVAYLAPLLGNQDAQLKRQVCCALAQVAKQSVDMAEVVVEADVLPRALATLKFPNDMVRRHAATLVREVAKHTPELAQLVVSSGGVGALVQFVADTSAAARLPGIMALGYIAAFSETLALAVIAERGLVPLMAALREEPEQHLKAATVWTLGQIGRHTPDHAKAVADAGGLTEVVVLESNPEGSEDLRNKCRRALKAVVSKLTFLPALDELVQADVPDAVMRLVLEQVGKVLVNDAPGRAQFVHSGGLAKVQQLAEAEGSHLKEVAEVINASYPEEVVKYYSPGYSQQLLQKLDAMAAQAAPISA